MLPMEHILLPTSITVEETGNAHTASLVVSPCQQGYGTTIGNALRRVLLSSLPGAAVESVKIDGVQHEFGAVEGVQEDVVEIMLNIKQIAVTSHSDDPVVLHLTKKGVGVVTAGDFEKNSDVEIVNPDLALCTITDAKKDLRMEIVVGRGMGYVQASGKETANLDLGTILVDSLYTPVSDVGYSVENTRVGDITDYEKLNLRIETNGTVSPKDAICQATQILMDHFGEILQLAQCDNTASLDLTKKHSLDEGLDGDTDDTVSEE